MGPLESMGSLDLSSLQSNLHDVSETLFKLGAEFESGVPAISCAFDASVAIPDKEPETFFVNRGLDALIEERYPLNIVSNMDCIKKLLDGIIDCEGNPTLALKKISEWKINEQFREQNINQHAGYAAEVISTAKENMRASRKGTGTKTFRVDDRPDLDFAKNDQYVDKIRIDSDGEIVDRVQTKFIAKDGRSWVDRMLRRKYDKYFNGNHVDKIECPKEFFKDAKAYLREKIEVLSNQLEYTTEMGNEEAAAGIQNKIDKLVKLDKMTEQSTVTKSEAIYAVKHPERYAKKTFIAETLKTSSWEGLKSGAITAGLTLVGSATEHIGEFLDGDISAEEMVSKIAAETGVAGAIGASSSFITTAIANSMQTSSYNLIKSVGGSCLPASIVSFGVESYDSICDFAQGLIEADELAYDLGHNAAAVTGGTLAGAKVGAMAGTVVGPIGTVAGGIVGGLVGTVVASGVYETVIEHTPEAAGEITESIEGYANSTMDMIANQVPDQFDNARSAFNDFFSSNNIPVRV